MFTNIVFVQKYISMNQALKTHGVTIWTWPKNGQIAVFAGFEDFSWEPIPENQKSNKADRKGRPPSISTESFAFDGFAVSLKKI
jgi:hypothetical protein